MIMIRRRPSSSTSSCNTRITFLLVLISIMQVLTRTDGLPVHGKAVIPEENVILPPTKVVLNGGAYTTLTTAVGSFTFPDVPAGTYLLEVLSPKYYFSQMKISVRPESESEDKILCLEFKYPGATKLKAAYPIVLIAHSQYQYFEKRDSWAAIRAHLSSPMTWMLLVSVATAFLFPKMLNSLDDEQKAELQKGSDPNALFQELLGGGAKKDKK